MHEKDREFMQAAIEVAWKSREHGNHPFGALLVSAEGEILLSAENTVVTMKDITGHAELNLVRMASQDFEPEYLAQCTIYTSTEPCPMCAGAIYWGNVRRIVFGLSGEQLGEFFEKGDEETINLPSREIFKSGNKKIEVVGPVLEDEALDVHEDFWS